MNLNLSHMSSNSNNDEKSIFDKTKDFWHTMPIFIKFIAIVTLVFYILSWIIPGFVIYLVNIPKLTVENYRLWTILTTTLITPSLLNIIFAFTSWIPSGCEVEKEIGTVAYLFMFFTHSIIIQVLFVIFAYSLSLASLSSVGLWPVILVEITVKCMKNPNSDIRFLFFPWPIKSKLYPLILIGFFFLINMGRISYDFIIAIVYGYLFHYFLKNKINYSSTCVQRAENTIFFKCLSKLNGFISIANNIAGFSISNQINNYNSKTNNSNSEPQEKKPSTIFQGKGSVVGSSINVKAQEELPKNINNEPNTSNVSELDKKEISTKQDYHTLEDSQNL